MSPAQVELARALVALPSWRWEAGALVAARDGAEAMRLVSAHEDADGRPSAMGLGYIPSEASPRADYWTEAGDLPDLTDAATGGVLLGRLTEYEVDRDERGVRVRVKVGDDWQPDRGVWSATPAEACARALIALESR